MTDFNLAKQILNTDGFLECYKMKAFWKGRVDPTQLTKLFSWDTLNHLLSTHRLTNDRLRLSLENDHVTPNKQAFRSVRDAFGRPTDFLSLSDLHRLLRAGATGVLEATNELASAIEALTQQISSRFDARSTANAYFSFGSTSGFGVHNDDHDVIVVQLDGRKTWNFFTTSNGLNKATVYELDTPTKKDVGETIILAPGDVLFIPKGTWHDVISIGEPSLHLTISIVYPTILDFSQWLLDQNRYRLPYRDIRMAEDDLALVASDCTAFFSQIVNEESMVAFLKTYYARHAARRIGPSLPSLNRIEPDDTFFRVPFSFLQIGINEAALGHIIIRALGREHILTEREYWILTTLSHKSPLSVAEIAATHSESYDFSFESIQGALEKLLDKALVTKGQRRVAALVD
ncbi:JmjC domain-containing protein [Cupriavidus sp. IDO]|uniref:JmjC domain-containing protein n=1 Tax=Cupriavidus sp. IDO TaxID=1539142 RepID=UPI000A68B825|nr:cupin domain-containing protein [Cupriavidus sp. IDO]